MINCTVLLSTCMIRCWLYFIYIVILICYVNKNYDAIGRPSVILEMEKNKKNKKQTIVFLFSTFLLD